MIEIHDRFGKKKEIAITAATGFCYTFNNEHTMKKVILWPSTPKKVETFCSDLVFVGQRLKKNKFSVFIKCLYQLIV